MVNTGQKSASERGFAAVGLDPTGDQDHKTGQILIFGTKPISDPRSHSRIPAEAVPGVDVITGRRVVHRLGLGPAQVRHAINWFDEGKPATFPLVKTARQLRRVGARRADLRLLFVRLLLEVALAKDRLHQKERAMIWTVCTELDIGRVELAQLEAMIRAQKGFRHSPAGDADARRIRQAYKMLGIESSATNDEIKTAYRRLMSKNHPDKIASTNPDAAVVAEADKRTREVRGAYEMLKARRSIR